MNVPRKYRGTGPIQGQLLRQNKRREVAIFLRDGVLWVADFIDGQGELVEATTWFRFNCATPLATHARWRMAVESATPLSEDLVQRIECLCSEPITVGRRRQPNPSQERAS